MKVSRTQIVVGPLLLILSIVLTYKWVAYSCAYPTAHTEPKNSTKKAIPLESKPIEGKAKNEKQVPEKAAKSMANQPKFKTYKITKITKEIPVIPLLDVLKAKKQPSRGQSIFFHETTNFRRTEKSALVQLTARAACAIESAALHNPGLTVFVLFAGATHRKLGGDPLIKALHKYTNIRLRHLNLWRYAAGTPIAKWLSSGKLFKSKFLFPHVSDLLRYVTLYKYGGIYLDLDVVVQQSLAKMPPNFTGAESNTSVACGVMKMSAGGLGHKIATMCLGDLEANYNGDKWGTNGPGVITRVAKKQCKTQSVRAMINNPKRCNGFRVYDPNAFYAIPWLQWKDFFQPNRLNATMRRVSKSPVVHVWNKFSRSWKLKTKGSCAYTKLAKTHCPRSFAAAGGFF